MNVGLIPTDYIVSDGLVWFIWECPDHGQQELTVACVLDGGRVDWSEHYCAKHDLEWAGTKWEDLDPSVQMIETERDRIAAFFGTEIVKNESNS